MIYEHFSIVNAIFMFAYLPKTKISSISKFHRNLFNFFFLVFLLLFFSLGNKFNIQNETIFQSIHINESKSINLLIRNESLKFFIIIAIFFPIQINVYKRTNKFIEKIYFKFKLETKLKWHPKINRIKKMDFIVYLCVVYLCIWIWKFHFNLISILMSPKY